MTYDFLEEIKAEYDLCINKPEEYQQKVDRTIVTMPSADCCYSGCNSMGVAPSVIRVIIMTMALKANSLFTRYL